MGHKHLGAFHFFFLQIQPARSNGCFLHSIFFLVFFNFFGEIRNHFPEQHLIFMFGFLVQKMHENCITEQDFGAQCFVVILAGHAICQQTE